MMRDIQKRLAAAVDKAIGHDRMLRQNSEPIVADAVGILTGKALEEVLVMPADLFEHHCVRFRLGEKGRDLVQVMVVAAPEIEGRDAQEAGGAVRRLRSGARQPRKQQSEADRYEGGGGGDQRPVPYGEGQRQQRDTADGKDGEAVIDNVEGGIPARQHAKRQKRCAEYEARDHGGLQDFEHRWRTNLGEGPASWEARSYMWEDLSRHEGFCIPL